MHYAYKLIQRDKIDAQREREKERERAKQVLYKEAKTDFIHFLRTLLSEADCDITLLLLYT